MPVSRPTRVSAQTAVWLILAIAALHQLAWFLASTQLLLPSNDSFRYLSTAFAPDGLFSDLATPAGYPIFLKIVGVLPERMVTIALVQHAIALATAYGAWILGRRIAQRLKVSDWWAVPATAWIAFSGDLAYFAHSAMSETLAIALLVALALVAERLTVTTENASISRLALLGLGAGALAGLSMTVRTIGGPTAAVLLGCCLIWVQTWRGRFVAAVAIALGALVIVGSYGLVAENTNGQKAGFRGMDGWYMYARTSSFADCNKMDPPPHLTKLCDTTPPDRRLGLFAYVYYFKELKNQTPAVTVYQWHPNGNEELREFGRLAIRRQPVDYLKTVLGDARRYFAPDAGSVPAYSGPGPEFLNIESGVTTMPPPTLNVGTEIQRRDPGPLTANLEAWQAVTRMPPLVLLLLLVLPPLAAGLTRRREVAATLLPAWLAASAAALAPVMLISFEYRYGLPSQVLLAIVGLPAAAALWQYFRPPTSPRTETAGADTDTPDQSSSAIVA